MTGLADFEALSFDCYGTLIDWESGIAAALAPWMARTRLEVPSAELVAAFGQIETGVQQERASLPYPHVLAEVMRRLGRRFGAAATDEEAAAFGASVPAWPAFPDSPGALAILAGHFRLIILSNVDRVSFAASNRLLQVDFDLVITAEDVGAYKPDPRHFEALLASLPRLGIGAGRLLHVAQSLFHDHAPARAAGLPTVWIDRRRSQPGWGATPPPPVPVEPDWSFPTMAAFAEAVAESSN